MSRPAGGGTSNGSGRESAPTSPVLSSETASTADSGSGGLEHQQARIDEHVHELARRLTSTQSQGGGRGSLFPLPANGPLDPSSADFDARKWTRAFYNLRRDALEGNPPKTTGVAFANLSAYGFGTGADFQKSVGNVALEAGALAKKLLLRRRPPRVEILHGLEGVVRSGQMVAVLGPPGSGCSTFLKTVAGDTHGFHVGPDSTINYQGIHPGQMRSAFRGEAVYTAEVDHHFPHLTVGDTLYFAARARCPRTIPPGVSRREYVEHLRDVTMNLFGIAHTRHTRVGDDFVRGVSGGERKRVTIAEAALSYSPLQCWDNSTRGLDSANAIEFCRTLRTQADVMGCTSFVAIYQAPQDAYDLFDKVLLLYQGRQIYFGPASEAKAFFEHLGFDCPEQQTTADFLTSMTSPSERVVRPGWEARTPRTPDDFARAWRESRQRARLMDELDHYLDAHPFHGDDYDRFSRTRRMDQSGLQRHKSPYTLRYTEQLALTLWRSFVMLRTDPSLTVTMLITNLFEALMISSIFYNLPETTASLDRRGLLIFFTMMINAFGSMLEIMTLYAKRNIVEKHARYALYHPSAEALASMIADLPYKVVNAIIINTILYFMGNLRREPGPYFFFLLVSFTTALCMSMLFRLIGSTTKSIAQALAPASIILLGLALYTGYIIPPQYMRGWISWARWVDPLFYSLEAAMLNDLVGRDFPCSSFIPSGPDYESVAPAERACSVQGSVPGRDTVSGEAYLAATFGYGASHRWRNFGILVAFLLAYMGLHLLATEYIAGERSKGEVLVFSRKAMAGRRRRKQLEGASGDEESGGGDGKARPAQQDAIQTEEKVADVERQRSIFHWRNVCYDIKIKGEPRRILDHVDGWVRPGTLTALMGASGAGKTTLLDVLASRVTTGVVTGDMLVDGTLAEIG
ncbi:hypothetical protein CDD83_308 [Cordyceps sp. RAO-2017]|nr:hypothetical protein CDD83_308 [Cordyceps sp. RAO-2017]